MGRIKKVGNGVAATVNTKASRDAKKAAKTTGAATGPVIKLTLEDRRWFENVMLKRELVQTEAQRKLEAIDKDANDLAQTLAVREGVDINLYELDWKALVGRLKTPEEMHPEAMQEAVPEQVPQQEA